MVGNAQLWRRIFGDTFAAEVSALREAVAERLLPTFDALEAEADAAAEREYERLGRLPAGDGFGLDPADAAERAQEVGIEFYQRMTGVRQGMLNLAAAGLYHLYEQQAAHFVRRELVSPCEERDAMFLRALGKPSAVMRVMRDRLSASGIAVASLRGFSAVDELRLVANVVKHGAGDSAEQLAARRRELFVHPLLRADPAFVALQSASRGAVRVSRPVPGEDLYVTPPEFDAYAEAVATFWAALGEALPGTR